MSTSSTSSTAAAADAATTTNTIYTIKPSEKNGLESVIISNNSGTSSVEILLFGGTLISWICDSVERIFVSPDAIYNGKQ